MCTKTNKANLSEINQLAETYMNKTFVVYGKEYNMTKLKWSFGYNNRKRSLGLCTFKSKKIELSKWVIDNSENSIETWNNTILHEIAHAIDSEIRGTSKHDYRWRNIALQIGCNGNRCSHVEHSESVTSKYTIICDNCNRKTPAHKTRKNIEAGRTSCGKCSPVFNKKYLLRIIQNY